MDSFLKDNPTLAMAWDYIEKTNRHIFLTGKAGTGKTTFLNRLQEHTAKQMMVTAPTGVAAITAKGVTLHSFFQLPFGPFIPGSQSHEQYRKRMFRFSKEKLKIIRGLDLLVIDEISMVRADLLDAVDAVLRRHRRNDTPFGGVQLLLIGDLLQLPPVAKPDEWQLLGAHYQSVYFFSSHALDLNSLITIELDHVYRQSDPEFIGLLNQIRDNSLDPAGNALLADRVKPGFTPEPGQGWITLTTHNAGADKINQNRLTALPGQSRRFDADVSGDFPDHSFPAPGQLALKPGAQVMFLRNDMSEEKEYYNGKIGKVTHVSPDQIQVTCPEDADEILVEKVEWEHVKYAVNEETQEIQQEVTGKFEQFPLKLAWAITIHKSQGLTFDRAVIDAGAAFAHGQVYVALSRCRTLEGMVLTRPISRDSLATDPALIEFIQSQADQAPDRARFEADAARFQQDLILQCFDFSSIAGRLGYLIRILESNAGKVQVFGIPDIFALRNQARETIFNVGAKFLTQMRQAFSNLESSDGLRLPETDAYITERTAKASAWFTEKFDNTLMELVTRMKVETDNAQLKKQLANALDNLKLDILEKRAGVASCTQGFGMKSYLGAVARARLGASLKPSARKRAKRKQTGKEAAPALTEADLAHPQLFETIRAWRMEKAKDLGLKPFQILHQKVLFQIVHQLPGSTAELAEISGVGPKTLELYGDALLNMVAQYLKTQPR